MATFQLNAQSKTNNDTIHVSGNCSMCKKRIEEAAYIKGVKLAEWNKSTRVLNVVYTSKTNKQAIINAVLSAGHDASGQKAKDQQYAKLPSCCAYRTGTCDH
ncbi:MAG: hypothetical protein FGM54_02200 [Chitinophagaceae bacterium]|nr:hypothetical protein [Chitinophagaceae bacterium]